MNLEVTAEEKRFLDFVSEPAVILSSDGHICYANAPGKAILFNNQAYENSNLADLLDKKSFAIFNNYTAGDLRSEPEFSIPDALVVLALGAKETAILSGFKSGDHFVMKFTLTASPIPDYFSTSENRPLTNFLLEAIPAPVFCKNTDHIYTACNTEFLEFNGFTREGVIGKSVYDVAPPNLADVYRKADDLLFAQGGKQVYETQIQNFKNELRDVVFHKSVVHNKKGQPIGLIGTFLDVTDRNKAQKQLLETQKIFSTVIDHSPAHIFVKDTNGVYQVASNNLRKFLAPEYGEIVGKTDFEFLDAETAQDFTNVDTEIARTGKPISFRSQLFAGGQAYDYLTIKFPIYDNNGDLLGISGILSNISELLAAEQKLTEAARDLESQIAERTKELSEEVQIRKQAEQDIFEILSISPIGVGMTRLKDNTVILENERLVRLLGSGRETLIGMNAELFWEASQTRQDFVDQLIKQKRFDASEVKIQRLNGEKFPAKVHGRYLERDGEPYAVFWVVDQTQELEIQQKLKRSENSLREMLAASPVALGISDVKTGKIHLTNKSLARLLNVPQEKLHTDSTLQFWINVSDRDAFVEEFERTGRVLPREIQIKRYTGETIWVLISWTSIMMEDDQKIVFWLNDISQTKQAEQVLKESHETLEKRVAQRTEELQKEIEERQKIEENLKASEEQFEAYANSASDWFWGMDENLKFNYLSDRFEEITGTAPDNFLNKNRAETYIGLEADEELEKHKSILAQHLPFREFKYGLYKEDGSIIYVTTSGVPIFDKDNNFKGYRGAGRDITQEILAAKQAREMEEQLHQAQKMEAIGQLTGGIAHDFNNILAIILGNIELVQEKVAQDPNLLKHLDVIERSAVKGATLTERLLAYSRKQELRPTTVDFNDLISGILTLVDRLLGETIQIEKLLDKTTPAVFADSSQLENALMNLCINARDAMPSGGKLRISTGTLTIAESEQDYPDLKPGVYSWLEVADNGKGMDENTLAHVFEPFFTTKEVGKGTGLGLSMVYGFVHQSNGTVSLQSQPEKGTRAKIILPSYQKNQSISD